MGDCGEKSYFASARWNTVERYQQIWKRVDPRADPGTMAAAWGPRTICRLVLRQLPVDLPARATHATHSRAARRDTAWVARVFLWILGAQGAGLAALMPIAFGGTAKGRPIGNAGFPRP